MPIQTTTLKKIMLCCAYFFLFLFCMMGHIPRLGGYLNKLTTVSMGILFVLCLVQNRKMPSNALLYIVVAFAYSLLLSVRNNYTGMLKLMLLIVATRSINFKTMIKFDIFCRIAISFLIIALCQLGIAPDIQSVFSDGRIRHSWGFQNSNHMGLCFCIVALELLYLWNLRLNIRRFGIIVGILVFVEVVSGSRTASMVIVMSAISAMLFTAYPLLERSAVVKWLLKYSVWIMACFAAIVSILYNAGNSAAFQINDLLSGRLANIQYYFSMFDVRVLGNNLLAGDRTLDTIYAYLLIGLGIVGFCVFCISFSILIERLFRKGEIAFAVVMGCLAVYGVSERLWMSVDYNILMLAFRELVYGDVFDNRMNERDLAAIHIRSY